MLGVADNKDPNFPEIQPDSMFLFASAVDKHKVKGVSPGANAKASALEQITKSPLCRSMSFKDETMKEHLSDSVKMVRKYSATYKSRDCAPALPHTQTKQ